MDKSALNDRLRTLPSIDEVLARPALQALAALLPHVLLKEAAREAVAEARARLRKGDAAGGEQGEVPDAEVAAKALRAAAPSLVPVLNATGIPLHTTLGRAPLHPEAVAHVARIAAGYSALELSLETGKRGHRADHVEALLRGLFKAEAAFAVNNCAGATLLGLAAVGAGRAAIVSRGELVEIGGGFRVPEIFAQSGVRLVEVGTTNKTRLEDYAAALDALGCTQATALDRAGSGAPAPALLLRVHRSNFAMVGFTAEPALEALGALARERAVPLLHDLGGGAVTSPPAPGLPLLETAASSLAAGAHLVMCSGDKLLGGPQAGLLVGEKELVARCRTHPLARALRLDKLLLAALETTLRLHRDGRAHELPALAALGASVGLLAERAVRLQLLLLGRGLRARVVSTEGQVGGGSLPLVRLESRAVLVSPPEGHGPQDLAAVLRQGRSPVPAGLPAPLAEALLHYGFGSEAPPVLARLHGGGLLLDVRCLADAALPSVAAAVEAALAGLQRARGGDRTATKRLFQPVHAARGPISTTMEGEEEV